MNGLFEELKRRNVLKVAAMYIVTGWLIVQVLDAVIPMLLLPDWVGRAILLLIIVGLPVALILAWAFELTPEGIMREKDVDRTQSITPQTGRRIDFLIIGVLIVAVAYFALDKFVFRQGDEAGDRSLVADADDERSIAVLPFVDMSPQQDQEYFSDGISEELLNVLIRVEGLRVASRTSSFAFKDTNQKIPEIAAELDVDHILEGSVRKAGERVRITAQLIDVSDDRHLWSSTYDRDLADIFAVQDEIANAIVAALEVALGAQPALKTASTDNVEAYNEYLRGRYFWNKRTVAGFEEAIEHYETAIEIDPGFSRAWSALAETWVLMPEYLGPGPEVSVPEAKRAIERALALDPESAEAYTARAYLRQLFERRWREAEEDYRKALELNPKYATAWQWYAESELLTGAPDFGLAKVQRAYELDPASPIINHVLAYSLSRNGRYEEALVQYEIVLNMAPDLIFTWYNVADTYVALERFDDALDATLRANELISQIRDYTPSGLVDPEVARAYIEALEDPALRPDAIALIDAIDVDTAGSFHYKAWMLASLGAVEPALEMMEAAYEAGWVYIVEIVHDPGFASLREHPRYLAIVEKLNMMEYLP